MKLVRTKYPLSSGRAARRPAYVLEDEGGESVSVAARQLHFRRRLDGSLGAGRAEAIAQTPGYDFIHEMLILSVNEMYDAAENSHETSLSGR